MREKSVAAAARGPARDFTEWVRPHWPDMHRLARRMVGVAHSDDIVQDALTSAWRSRDQFDPDRGSARVWLLTIVANQARKHHRSARATFELVEDVPARERIDTLRVDLDAALGALTDRQRLIMTLHYYLDLSVVDVAAIADCTPGTVKSTLSDSRARLRTILGGDYL